MTMLCSHKHSVFAKCFTWLLLLLLVSVAQDYFIISVKLTTLN